MEEAMNLNRRRLLQMGAAAGVGMLLPGGWARSASALVPAGVTPFTEQLPTLADLGVIDATGGASKVLNMVNGTHSFHSALGPADTFCYQEDGVSTQEYLGPVIVAKQDVAFDLTVNNQLRDHPLAFAVESGLHGVSDLDKTAPRTATHLHVATPARSPTADPKTPSSPEHRGTTTTATPRKLPGCGTTITRWASPGSTCTPGWRAATWSATATTLETATGSRSSRMRCR
jgi:hypothetical protein